MNYLMLFESNIFCLFGIVSEEFALGYIITFYFFKGEDECSREKVYNV